MENCTNILKKVVLDPRVPFELREEVLNYLLKTMSGYVCLAENVYVSRDVYDKIIGEIQAGKKIQAIKTVRQHTGLSLRPAKETVESMMGQAGKTKELPFDKEDDEGIS